MMAQRSLFRPDQLDSNGSYQFAQLIIDGYSGGDLQDGYLMGLVLTDGYLGGDETVRIDAHDGAITQIGTGQVSFAGNVDAANGLDVNGGDLYVANNTTIAGNLLVQGTTTTFDTEQMIVTDPITVINASGSELTSTWAGLSARDTDGYNRIGWMFDGYWAISDAYSALEQPDAVPSRAIAFVGAGDTNGDLSSVVDSDSGADKIGVTTITGLTGNTVQAVLESIDTELTGLESGTPENTWTLNNDATPAADEDACFIMAGGDGVALIEGYLCVVTDTSNGDRFRFTMYQDGSQIDTDVHLGERAATDDIDAYLTFNAGDGGTAYQGRIGMDGNGNMSYIAPAAGEHIFVAADVRVQEAFLVDGSTTLGDSDADTLTVNATITSDLMPTDCTYQLGDDDNRWLDGYFCLFSPIYYTPVGSNNSLEGHLKGIDNAFAGGIILKPERGVYEITVAEANIDELDTSRAVDQGTIVDVGSWTDNDFRDYAYVYWNGQFLYNSPTSAADQASVANDVARKTGSLSTVIFAGNLKRSAIIQIIDMR